MYVPYVLGTFYGASIAVSMTYFPTCVSSDPILPWGTATKGRAGDAKNETINRVLCAGDGTWLVDGSVDAGLISEYLKRWTEHIQIK